MHKSVYKNELFKNVDAQEVNHIFASVEYSTRTYSKGEVIAIQGSRCNHLLILAEGVVSAETTDRSQKTISVERISAPALIAPGFLYAENNILPVNINTRKGASVLFVAREDFSRMMCENMEVMTNFMRIISTPNRFISDKVVYLTYKTMKGKFANFLLDQIEENGNTTFRNPLTQREMAEMFGVTRPALARAIGELADEGTIYVKGKEVSVLFTEKLRQYAKN